MEAEPAPPGPGKGRPTTFDPDLGRRVCERIIEGESLRRITAEDGMPSRGMLMRWLAANPEFRMEYRQARLLAAELMADELLDLADDASRDWIEDSKGDLKLDREAVLRSRLRIETRQYLLGKLLPRTYGARIEAPLLPAEPGADAPPGEAPTINRLLTEQQRDAVGRALAAKFALEELLNG